MLNAWIPGGLNTQNPRLHSTSASVAQQVRPRSKVFRTFDCCTWWHFPAILTSNPHHHSWQQASPWHSQLILCHPWMKSPSSHLISRNWRWFVCRFLKIPSIAFDLMVHPTVLTTNLNRAPMSNLGRCPSLEVPISTAQLWTIMPAQVPEVVTLLLCVLVISFSIIQVWTSGPVSDPHHFVLNTWSSPSCSWPTLPQVTLRHEPPASSMVWP